MRFVVVALALVACTNGPGDDVIDVVYDPCQPALVTLDASAPASATQDLADALAMWKSVGNVRLTAVADGTLPTLPIRFESAAPMFHGVYDDEVGVVVINTRMAPGHDTAVTIAHELGHALGLPHREAGDDSVMLRGNFRIEPTASDTDTLFSLWGACVDHVAAE